MKPPGTGGSQVHFQISPPREFQEAGVNPTPPRRPLAPPVGTLHYALPPQRMQPEAPKGLRLLAGPGGRPGCAGERPVGGVRLRALQAQVPGRPAGPREWPRSPPGNPAGAGWASARECVYPGGDSRNLQWRCPNGQEERAYRGHMQLGRPRGWGAKGGGRLGSLPSPCSRKYHPPESTWAPTPALLEALRRVIPLNLHVLICKRGRIRPRTSPGAGEHAV